MDTDEVIAAHRAAGRDVLVSGVRSFVLDHGAGPAVVCVHGVPTSSYLYRKVIVELAGRGLRGIAPDLPGLGLAERPGDFDYSWSGLGGWLTAAVDHLTDGPVHLLVHDIGGPIGFEVAASLPGRVASLTILNTITDPATYRPPPVMWPFTRRGLDRLWLHGPTDWIFVRLVRLQGLADRTAAMDVELAAYRHLLNRDDGGRAFLRIMKGFELTEAKSALYRGAIRAVPHRQVIWGDRDPVLRFSPCAETAAQVADVPEVTRLSAKHFLQEDQAPAIADRVAALIAQGTT